MKKVSLIIPCYNEEAALPIFYREVKGIMESLNYEYELVFIDDGSSDHTLSILKELSCNDERITYISFSRNYGKEAAMYAGFAA